MTQTLRFGIAASPAVADLNRTFASVQAADEAGLDFVGLQDHPYQPAFADTMTVVTTLLAATERISILPNVASLPLRPPAVLAKTAATLDIISGGRFVLGLGSGAFWNGITAMGGPSRNPGEAVDSLKEAVDVIRLMWSGERAVSYDGAYYQLTGTHPGPTPMHGVPIWIGAYRPRMLKLVGRYADGWLPGLEYAPQAEYSTQAALRESHRRIDEAALAAGRDPGAITRALNLIGDPDAMADRIPSLAEDGFDTFILWPSGSDPVSSALRWSELAGQLRNGI